MLPSTFRMSIELLDDLYDCAGYRSAIAVNKKKGSGTYSFVKELASFFRNFGLLINIGLQFKRLAADKPQAKLFFLGSTINQAKVLLSLSSFIENRVFFSTMDIKNSPEETIVIPNNLKRSFSWLYNLAVVLYRISNKFSSNSKVYNAHPVKLKNTFSELFFWRIALRLIKPKIICFSNDHSHSNRSLMLAAKIEGITTLYLQHADITEKFPRLITSYAFLDGKKALKCLQARGIDDCKVYLTGPLRMNQLDQKSSKIKGKSCLGLAINSLDKTESVRDLIDQLLFSKHIRKLVIRPHPRMSNRTINFILSSLHDNRIYFSDPKEESVADFLFSIDLMIAGETSIHGEAFVAGVTSIYYNMGSGYRDHYGFIRTGLLKVVKNENEILNIIQNDERPYSCKYNILDYWYSNLRINGKIGVDIATNEALKHAGIIKSHEGENMKWSVDKSLETKRLSQPNNIFYELKQ